MRFSEDEKRLDTYYCIYEIIIKLSKVKDKKRYYSFLKFDDIGFESHMQKLLSSLTFYEPSYIFIT